MGAGARSVRTICLFMAMFDSRDKYPVKNVKLLFIGPETVYHEMVNALPQGTDVKHSHQPVDDNENYHVVFDALFDGRHELPNGFVYPTAHLIIGASVKRSLSESKELLKQHLAAPIIGMNMLPTFLSAKTKETVMPDDDAQKRFEALVLTWEWNFKVVNDVVGMVTPRVLAMVINEAAHTLEENTASRDDIDRGMELGTGYPQGPLKWCDAIGVSHVTDVLQALEEKTGHARYRTAPLLLRMRQARETFY
jgi:3-hydroxybutyryl-CoA dehydrogenase